MPPVNSADHLLEDPILQGSIATQILRLHCDADCTCTPGDAWHIMVEGLRDIGSLAYGWRADAADISRFYPGTQTT
jgi:hypothetical protein